MESKEEISDTDSGIILQSSPDSPTSSVKDVTTHTRAVKLKQQSLQDQLELCLLELKKLCIREAELTGKLSSDYPLLPGEKPPRIRRRIGAAFKLDEESFRQDGEDVQLRSLEADLALQTQIFEAARRLSQEDHLSKQVRRSRLQHCKLQEKKMKELQEVVFQLRLHHGRSSPRPLLAISSAMQRELTAASDDSSLSDAVMQDEEEGTADPCHPSLDPVPLVEPFMSPRASPQPKCHSPLVFERAPIQNSPWKESSLDQPYEKPKRSHSIRNSQSCSPTVTRVSPLLDPRLGEASPHPTPGKHLALRHMQSSSAPSTPDLHVRRQHSLRIPNGPQYHNSDQSRGRPLLARRRLTDLGMSTEYMPLRPALGHLSYQCGSEDSGSECSVSSYASSPCHETLADAALPSRLPQGHQYNSHHGGLLAFTGPNFYKVHQYHSTPSFYRGCMDDRIGYPAEMDAEHVHMTQHLPGRYEYLYDYKELPQQWVPQPCPPHTRLARTPSLRNCPTNYGNRGLSRDQVSDELRFWHQRSQSRGPRPQSLDRQGAIRVKNLQGWESPVSSMHNLPEQAPQRRIVQRPSDGMPVHWFIEEDSEIISQV